VFSGDWSEASVRKAASGAAKAGYSLVEIPSFNADRLDIAMTKRVFNEHGVRPACSLGLSLDADISSADRDVVAKGAVELEKALAFASGIGSKHLCGILYSALAKYPQPPTAEGRRNCIEQLQLLAIKAEDKGVKLCLEVVNR
jgi:D-psicose/D-tagatose/L-ribulose 3-epimerase